MIRHIMSNRFMTWLCILQNPQKNSLIQVLAHSQHLLDGRAIDPKPAKAQKKDTKLFVGGLNPDTEDDKIVEHFKKWGEVSSSIVLPFLPVFVLVSVAKNYDLKKIQK